MAHIGPVSGAGAILKVGGRGAHVQRKAPEIFCRAPILFGSTSRLQLLVFVSALVSIQCDQFFLLFSQPFVKVGARAPAPYGVGVREYGRRHCMGLLVSCVKTNLAL